MNQFHTSLIYNDRESKAKYIFDKYQSILKYSVLDVGADAMFLKPILQENGVDYCGIGYGDGIDIETNLESLPYSFEGNSFHTVVCLDVLEHLENIHRVFDELCRISREYILISLPNPFAGAFGVLRGTQYSTDQSMKFYGLPVNYPNDRHRWFFSEVEAVNFITKKAKQQGFVLMQFDAKGEEAPLGGRGVRGLVIRKLLKSIFRSDIEKLGLNHGTLWFVLKKDS